VNHRPSVPRTIRALTLLAWYVNVAGDVREALRVRVLQRFTPPDASRRAAGSDGTHDDCGVVRAINLNQVRGGRGRADDVHPICDPPSHDVGDDEAGGVTADRIVRRR